MIYMKTQDDISIFIDNNVWDLFFKFNVDLSSFFQKHFKFYIPIVVKYESEQFPSGKDNLDALKAYIDSQEKNVNEDVYFMSDTDGTYPRGGGWDSGVFTSAVEAEALAYFTERYPLRDKRRPDLITFPDSRVKRKNRSTDARLYNSRN